MPIFKLPIIGSRKNTPWLGTNTSKLCRLSQTSMKDYLLWDSNSLRWPNFNWSFALAEKIDLSTWDFAETLNLFDSAEEKMKAATGMWEKLEEQRLNELEDPNSAKEEELLRRKKKQVRGSEGEALAVAGQGEISPEEAAEQAAVMRSQNHLFWGNMLFERSQVECKLGLDGWKEKLDAAVERFKSAGASEPDISVLLRNHCSHVNSAETTEMKQAADNANNNVIIETS